MVSNEIVPGAMEFKQTGTGIRWRYSQAVSLATIDDVSERTTAVKAYTSISSLMDEESG